MLPAAVRMAARPALIKHGFVLKIQPSLLQTARRACASQHVLFHHIPSKTRCQTRSLERHVLHCSSSSSFRSFTKNKWGKRPRAKSSPNSVKVSVVVMVEGKPIVSAEEVEKLQEAVEHDAPLVVEEALKHRAATNKRYKLPGRVELSCVLCDDDHIRELNAQTRGKDAPTDVLSFEMDDDMDFMVRLPIKLLGDIVISVDTALAQAQERGHSLEEELRVLLVHGVTHLCGFDHEKGEEQLQLQAAEEQRIMAALGWQGSGLISLVSSDTDSSGSSAASTETQLDTSSISSAPSPVAARYRSSDVQLVALDMDGTLLDSSSKILPSSVEAIKAAIGLGVKVIIATGKARPGAILACQAAGLTGDDLLVSHKTPGIFLQGLAVHGVGGALLSDAQLPADVVAKAFEFVQNTPSVSCCAFLGDTCATLKMTDDIQALHHVYYEPLSEVLPSIDALLAGPPVRKLLFMSSVQTIEEVVKKHWTNGTVGQGASVMQAVDTMLEVVPAGVDKWAGLQRLLPHLRVDPDTIMAVGDGSNDLSMIANAGLGIAMGNAGKKVKAAASVVVASNDEGGIAEAFERFVL